MAQQHASGGQLPDEIDRDTDGGGTVDQDSSSRLEQFGVGVATSILLGAIVGVAATTALDAGGIPLLIALGTGFILAPLVGLLFLRRGE